MRQVKLLADLTTPEGVLPAGAEITVEDAEAKLLLGARGLAEDLGEVEPAPAAAGGPAEGGADSDQAKGDKPRRRAR